MKITTKGIKRKIQQNIRIRLTLDTGEIIIKYFLIKRYDTLGKRLKNWETYTGNFIIHTVILENNLYVKNLPIY